MKSILAISSLILLTSCAKQPPVLNPTLPKTALQWTIIYNGAVAKSNRTVEQAVETVQKSGLLTVEQVRPVIVASGKVATVSESVRGITSQGSEATWSVDGPKIRALLQSADLKLPASANPAVDLAISTVNAALLLLTQGVQ